MVEVFGIFLDMVAVGVYVPSFQGGVGVEVENSANGYGERCFGNFLGVEQR